MDADALTRTLQEFLADTRAGVVLEDGAVLFDMAQARYSISAEHGRCLLHLWSEERNAVRRIVDATAHGQTLRLEALRFGAAQPARLEICRDPDLRTASARKVGRAIYRQRLRQVLERNFRGWRVGQMSSGLDLGHSSGPIYSRGVLRRGRSAFAVLGVGGEETQASIDGALTFAVLWLDGCRESLAARAQVEGVKLFLPRGASAVARERMAHLDCGAAKWGLYELDEREGEAREVEVNDGGNLATRLLHCPDEEAARRRFAESVARVAAVAPEAEAVVVPPAEISFRVRGLEFARARMAPAADSFRLEQQIWFGIGAEETPLTPANSSQFEQLAAAILACRTAGGARDNLAWRMHSERWLESRVMQDVSAIDRRLDPACAYSQVPAFSAADRAMVDVLSCTRDGRLAVLELKADEDIHLPLQGLDYWARVRWHQSRDEFRRFGYFPGRELGPQAPLLMLVAPALHIHPASDRVLRYLSPAIEWTLAAVNESWREKLDVVFRKRREDVRGRKPAAQQNTAA
jgi:hypothetical protein